ncbi:MAG TPA: hypothetical protein VKG80_23840 [Trebonia sp.]|nr:hypothetical protein [Trebonia sp.]
MLEHRAAELERRLGHGTPEPGGAPYRAQDFGTLEFAAFEPPQGGGTGHDRAGHRVPDAGRAYQEAGPDFRYADTGFGYAGGVDGPDVRSGAGSQAAEQGANRSQRRSGRQAPRTARSSAAGSARSAPAASVGRGEADTASRPASGRATVSNVAVGDTAGEQPSSGRRSSTARRATAGRTASAAGQEAPGNGRRPGAAAGRGPVVTGERPAPSARQRPGPATDEWATAATREWPAPGAAEWPPGGTETYAGPGAGGFHATNGYPGTGASGYPDAGVGGPDERTEVLINRGRRNVRRSGFSRWAAHWRAIAVTGGAIVLAVIVAAFVLPGGSAAWPASVATVQAEISVACQNPNVASEPSQVNFACAKATRQILWVFSLLTSGDNPAFTDSSNGRKGLEPITPAQGGDIAWSLNLHHPYDAADPTDSLAVAARAINNIIGGATLTGSNGAPVVQPGLESKPANCTRYTGSSSLVTKAGFPALCALPITSASGQAALVSDVFQQWMVGTTAQVATEAAVLFQNADNPSDSRVQAILNTLPDSGL